MKRIYFPLIFCCIISLGYTACKPAPGPITFAQRLQNTCTAPFVGPGDSSRIYLPTAFTPNGDGINDMYMLQGTACRNPGYFTSFAVNIYEPTGNMIYQSTDGAFMWDGKSMKTGTLSTEYKLYAIVKYTTTGGITDSVGTYLFLLSGNAARSCVNAVATDSSKYLFPDQFDPLTAAYSKSFPSFEVFCN